MGAQCPHAYPNVPDEFTNQTTGKTFQNPSDCTCKMSAAKSKVPSYVSSWEIAKPYLCALCNLGVCPFLNLSLPNPVCL